MREEETVLGAIYLAREPRDVREEYVFYRRGDVKSFEALMSEVDAGYRLGCVRAMPGYYDICSVANRGVLGVFIPARVDVHEVERHLRQRFGPRATLAEGGPSPHERRVIVTTMLVLVAIFLYVLLSVSESPHDKNNKGSLTGARFF